MALSAVIVDDEQLARDELAYLLRELDVDILAQGKNGVEAVSLVNDVVGGLCSGGDTNRHARLDNGYE